MAKSWINDRWLTDAVKMLDDGSKVHVPPSSAVKRALSIHIDDPEKAKVPAEFRTSVFGQGARWAVYWTADDEHQTVHGGPLPAGVANLGASALGMVPLGRIGMAAIQRWVAQLVSGDAVRDAKIGQARPLAPKSIRSVVKIVFKTILDVAVSNGWLLKNPVTPVKLPRALPVHRRIYLTPHRGQGHRRRDGR